MGAEESAISVFIRYSPPWLINILTLVPNKLMQAVEHSMSSATKAAGVMIRDRMEAIKGGETLTNDALTLMSELLQLIHKLFIAHCISSSQSEPR
jgi:hypothetical protein